MLRQYTEETNVLIITLDSCRWDAFENASAASLRSLCRFRKAYTQGTYTYPAHVSIYSGILPNTIEPEPYYNRFKKNLFRIGGRNVELESYINFTAGTENIIIGFEKRGYGTFGCAASDWFKHPSLYMPFQDFRFTGINVSEQVNYAQKMISSINGPFFMLINIGETHDPYEFGGQIEPSLMSRARMRSFSDCGFLEKEYEKQIAAVEYIDGKLIPLFEMLKSNDSTTLVVVCADHGECFGEDGLYGHGFYHPKVMEVPLGIFEI